VVTNANVSRRVPFDKPFIGSYFVAFIAAFIVCSKPAVLEMEISPESKRLLNTHPLNSTEARRHKVSCQLHALITCRNVFNVPNTEFFSSMTAITCSVSIYDIAVR
jgi:hypothetical protein